MTYLYLGIEKIRQQVCPQRHRAGPRTGKDSHSAPWLHPLLRACPGPEGGVLAEWDSCGSLVDPVFLGMCGKERLRATLLQWW